jgi:hypothetical protein
LVTAMTQFFNVAGTGGAHALSTYISPVMSRGGNAVEIELYDITGHLDGTPHGSPIGISNFTLGSPLGGTTLLPEGVAATISFQAAYGTDVEFGPGTRPRSRDRNRVYIPALMSNAVMADPVTSRCKFTPAFITDCLAALYNLSQTHTFPPDSWNLRVWSRKNAGIKVPSEGWMDDRPDYQRRRTDQNPGSRAFRALTGV